MEDERRFDDEDRHLTGPEGQERGDDPDAPIAAPDEPSAVDDDAVTEEGLRDGGGLEDRLDQEQPDRAQEPPALEEAEDAEHALDPERDRAGPLVDEGPGPTDREKDEVAAEGEEDGATRSAEEEALRVEEGDVPGGVEGGDADPYVDEP